MTSTSNFSLMGITSTPKSSLEVIIFFYLSYPKGLVYQVMCLLYLNIDFYKQFFLNGCGFHAVSHAHLRIIAGTDDFFISYI